MEICFWIGFQMYVKEVGKFVSFHSHTNPVFGQVLVHSVNKTHALVVTMELIWLLFLNILTFNFAQTPNKSLRFRRFSKSYINDPVVALTTIKVTLPFCLIKLFKSAMFHFCSCYTPKLVHLRNLFLLSTPVAWMLLTPRWVSRDEKSEIVVHIFISRRATFSANPHLAEEATFYTLKWFELN